MAVEHKINLLRKAELDRTFQDLQILYLSSAFFFPLPDFTHSLDGAELCVEVWSFALNSITKVKEKYGV